MQVFNVAETASLKPGDGDLKLLEAVPNLIGNKGTVPEGGGAHKCGKKGHNVRNPVTKIQHLDMVGFLPPPLKNREPQ